MDPKGCCDVRPGGKQVGLPLGDVAKSLMLLGRKVRLGKS